MRRAWQNHPAILRGLLLLMAGAFLLMGALRGEVGVVLKKSINICLECIGVGA